MSTTAAIICEIQDIDGNKAFADASFFPDGTLEHLGYELLKNCKTLEQTQLFMMNNSKGIETNGVFERILHNNKSTNYIFHFENDEWKYRERDEGEWKLLKHSEAANRTG